MGSVETVIAVQRMQDYIEMKLFEKITLKALANAAGYSPWHASRLFKEALGKTPFEYIRARRLTKAALVLRDENERIIDVALEFVFDSHEGFTRAFSKTFGMSPSVYSQKKPPIQLFLPYKVYDTYKQFHREDFKMEQRSESKTVFVQIVERPTRKVLLKRGISASDYFTYCDEVGCDVWSVLTSVKEALYEPIGMWLPNTMRPLGTSEYVQGVEVGLDYNNTVPEGFELVELPACKMMVFQGQPYEDEAFMEEIGAVWQHIETFDPQVYGYDWAPEEAPRFQLAPMGYRGYIEARPVKAMDMTSKP